MASTQLPLLAIAEHDVDGGGDDGGVIVLARRAANIGRLYAHACMHPLKRRRASPTLKMLAPTAAVRLSA